MQFTVRQKLVLGSFFAAAALGFHALGQTLIPESAAMDRGQADKAGFIWGVHQVSTSQPNTHARTEAQLAGLLGTNLADPAAVGIASGPGVLRGGDPSAPVDFVVETVVNFDQSAGSNGTFQPDDAMPGIPGTSQSTDNIAGELLGYLDLPVGDTEIGVNSDDGFRLSLGGASPRDRFAIVVGEFEGERGSADTWFKVRVTKAGLYAYRLIWEEGDGGANLEFKTRAPDGTETLVNDAGGVRSYYSLKTAAGGVYASAVTPAPGSFNNSPASAIEVVLEDATALGVADVALKLDGVAVAADVRKAGAKITVKHTPTALFASGSKHAVELKLGARTQGWSFTTAVYPTLEAGARVTADATKPGWRWNIFQNIAAQTPSNQRAEDALAGRLIDAAGDVLLNTADPAARGNALEDGKPGTTGSAPLSFEIPEVINYNQTAGQNAGNFGSDVLIPGLGAAGNDGVAAEAIGYWQLSRGLHVIGVNSDDGFRMIGGAIGDVLGAQVLGEYDGGRTAADTLMYVNVEADGVYPIRTLWQEASGEASLEIFSVDSTGKKTLVNAPGGIVSYRAADVSGAKPFVRSARPKPGEKEVSTTGLIELVITDQATTVVRESVELKLGGAKVAAVVEKNGGETLVRYTPNPDLETGVEIAAEISFTDSVGAKRVSGWTFTTTVLGRETLFLEAEDFDFGSGNFVTGQKIGFDGPYPGGVYENLGTAADLGIDWLSSVGNAGQTFRPDTQVAAGKGPQGSAGSNRGYFQVEKNWIVGWRAAGDWQNYTRSFPTPAKYYNIYGFLASGGNPIQLEISEVTAGVGTANQTVKSVGYFRPGRSTGDWDRFEMFQAVDGAGNPMVIELGGRRTLRLTTLPGGGDIDYLALVPSKAVVFTGKNLKAEKTAEGAVRLTWEGNAILQGASVVDGPYSDTSIRSGDVLALDGVARFYRFKP